MTGAMHQYRTLQPATLLPDGRVLVAGSITGCGFSTCSTILASAELYDPRGQVGAERYVPPGARLSDDDPAAQWPGACRRW
jgi:hypothetical protein